MQRLDWIALAICVGVALPMPGLGEFYFSAIEKQFVRFAKNKRIAVATIGAATILVRLMLLWAMPVPEPKIHDEFSYLLAGDTFVRGRLSNPPHPMSIFFDTFHVIQHPSYASMYPPAQGAVLAIGQLLGHPWIGVLLSTAAMCMAIIWMLQGWMQPEWALLGGILVLLRFGIFSYWMNSYWGGAVAATGAALVLGAFPRIIEFRRASDAVIFGLGAGILATSRPVEGLIFCVPLTGALLWRALRTDPSTRSSYAKRVLLPIGGILVCIVGFVGYYNWRITESPIVFPHFIEQRMYVTTPIFLWQHEKPPQPYPNPQFEDFYNNFMPSLYQTGWDQAVDNFWSKATEFWQFFLGPVLSIPSLALPWLLRDRRIRLLVIQVAISAIGLWIIVFYHAHYAAPAAVTVYLLLMFGMRRMRGWQFRGHFIGVGLTRLIVLFSLLIGPVYFLRMILSESNPVFNWFQPAILLIPVTVLALAVLRLGSLRTTPPLVQHWAISFCEVIFLVLIMWQVCLVERNLHADDYPILDYWSQPFRKPIEQRMAAMPGQHLVLVRYAKDHNSGEEYVYNEADIDHAKTVWAREIPGVDLSPLLNYFRNRDAWVFEPDEDNEIVSPYSPQTTSP